MDASLNTDKLCNDRYPLYTTDLVVPGTIVFSAESATEPVTLAEAKKFMHIGFIEDDDHITELIKAAREWVEKLTGVSLIARTITCTIQVVHSLELPYGPVTSTRDGFLEANTDIAADNLTEGQFPRVTGLNGRYKVSYTAGYNPVPKLLKMAVLNKIISMYENRGEADKVNYDKIALNNLRPYKRITQWL